MMMMMMMMMTYWQARRRGLFMFYNGIAKVSSVTFQNTLNVRHGEAKRRIFKLFTAIVQTYVIKA
jgi:hypothetical protein